MLILAYRTLLLESTDFEASPADQREEKELAVDKQTKATPAPATIGLAQPSTQKELKDLFAPREEEGELLRCMASCPHKHCFLLSGFSLIGHLDLDSELDLDMEPNPNEPANPSTAAPAPAATSSRSAVSNSAPTTQHKALDSLLLVFFLQKGHVQSVSFARTVDEAEIRVSWEAARGELTWE